VALTRKFIDSDGIHWQVYELSDESAVRERSWLYFFSRGETKSLSAYPDDWAVMDWPGLSGSASMRGRLRGAIPCVH